ncbi:MAG: SRPBCC family protein [Actinomycetes bacterium]
MAPFTIVRSTHIDAPPARVHALVNDFRAWQQWSPWEGLDAELRRTYSAAASGVGAHYAWSGNRKAGEGSMEITGSTPERVDVALTFTKPWKARNHVSLSLTAAGGGTDVAWTMTGDNKGLAAVFARLFNMDAMLGKDFEKGLAQLKAAAEA